MKAAIHSIFKTFFLSLCIVAQVHFAHAVDQGIISPAKTTFFNSNGAPLSSGKVYFYVPNTTTGKTTYQDFDGTIPNLNPVVLDAAGRASIWGTGQYRQIVKDKNNNTIWDLETSAAGSGSSGGGTATGDGDLVGTVKPWAGIIAPNQYMFTYGQEVSRTTFSVLYTAITSTQPIFCNSSSPILTGLSDTNSFWIGMSLEVSCVAAGFTTIISKTASTVTMATNANVTASANATFFPWGRGNGTTTFNLPDFRGFTLAGNNIMGGVSSSQLNTTFFGATDPNSAGAAGGSQSTTLVTSNEPSHLHGIFLNDPGHTHTTNAITTGSGLSVGGGTNNLQPANNITNNTGITIRDATGTASTQNQTTPSGGGIATAATIGVAGSGYTNGSQTITVAGGTCTTQPQFTVTVAGNIFTGTPSLLTAGNCTVAPTNPAATTGGGGTGGTLNVSYSAQPFSRVQPTKTTNYIIKVTPDANSLTASGVTDIQSMTGSIGCGSGLTCTGNIISVNNISLVIGGTVITSGTNTRVLFNNAGLLGEYTISGTGNVAMTTSPVFVTPTLGVANGTSLALGGCTIGSNVFCTVGSGYFASSSANALAVGANGATNPAFNVDASTGSSATGLNIKSAAAAAGLAVSVLSSGTNENLTIDAKGSGTVTLGNTSTGNIVVNRTLASINHTVTSASANALVAGLNGVTNPAFNVDASTASSATGLNIKSAAAAGGLAVAVLSSGTNEALTVNAKGNGLISIGNTSTGGVALGGGGGNVTAGGLNVTVTVASGTSALGTSLIASGACASVVTTAATGTATTDVVDFGFNGDPTATTGYIAPNMLAIVAYPSSNNVNFKVCNNTGGSITPSAITLNWKVRR